MAADARQTMMQMTSPKSARWADGIETNLSVSEEDEA
jgi:hypothetical protein